MNNDIRYESVKVLIYSGHIKSIRDIFQYIPKTTVYKDLGINFNRFDRAIVDPAKFRLQELMSLADMFGVDAKKFIELAYDQSIAFHRCKAPLAKEASNL